MSLITRCPACGTMFRVVPDQLRISEGWVRCGHCADVFDASAHLQPQALAVPPPAEAPPAHAPAAFTAAPEAAPSWAPPVSLAEPAAPAVAAPAMQEAAQEQEPAQEQDQHWAAQTPDESWAPAPLSPGEPAEPHSLAAAQEPPAAEPEVISAPMHRPALPDDAPAHAAPEEPAAHETTEKRSAQPKPPAVEEPTESTIEDMSFVREARRKAFWRRGSVRAAAGVFCLLLLAVLALQVAVHERDRLAVLEPRAKPWLDELCAPLGCKVAPLRQIESLVIESSSFNKVRGSAYRLSISVRNKAAMPLAMPGIELALTDSQDQPVLRRVLLPADLGAAAVIAPGAEWSTTLPVSVAANGQAARIAGYRLLAFYP